MKLRALFWYLIVVFGVAVAGVMFLAMRTDSLPEKQPNAITITVEDKIYDGTPITLTAGSTSGTVPTVMYKLSGASDSTLTADAPTNAGEYVAIATVAEEWNYTESSKTAKFSILPRAVSLIWAAPLNLVYNGQPKVPSATVSGVLSGEECAVEVALSANNNNIKAGSFTFTAVRLTNSNYGLPTSKVSPVYTIDKANYNMSSARWNYTAAFDYDGTNKTVTVVGLPSGVTVARYSNNVKTYVGKYTASVVLNYDTINYNQPIIQDLNWNITSKNMNITIVQTSTNYIGDRLSSVLISCNDPTATIQWVNGTQLLNAVSGVYQVKYTAADGERTEYISVTVVAIDNTVQVQDYYIKDDMYFTLDHSNHTASVRANTDQIQKAIIPETINCNGTTYTVNKIETYGFKDMDRLTEVYVPGTITWFGSVAFSSCDALTKVRFDDSLSKLTNQAFMYCYSLSDVILPSSITEVPLGLFYSCSALTSITIPSGVTKLDDSCFYGTAIEEIVIPSGVTEIGRYAFYNTEIETITIPAAVTVIEEKAFAQTALKEIEILSSDITIGEKCFDWCRDLREIYLCSQSLVNSINSNTEDTHCLLAFLQNQDILYIKDTITNITSSYIISSFTQVTSNIGGYSAYQFGKYTINSLSSATNRIYVKNGGLYGDEYISVTTPSGNIENVTVTASMLECFDTSSVGKKMARITYNHQTFDFIYYVLNSLTDASLNCITSVTNLLQTYYVGESVNLTNAKINLVVADGGYMKTKTVNITTSMVSGFNSSTVGSRTMTVIYNSYRYELPYNVKTLFTETVTSNSFKGGVYYAEDTTEYTPHFTINIKKGSYLYAGYKDMIEYYYETQEAVSGLEFADMITIDVDDTHYPSCGGTTLYLTSSCLFINSSSTFSHELAHALDHSQSSRPLANSVLTEGFASYIEYLTAKKMFKDHPEIYAYGGSYNMTIHDYFNTESYFYDFEDRLIRLGRDELAANSQYEIGGRMFSYLHHRYGDFCSWMEGSTYRTSTIDAWLTMIKSFYNNANIFDEYHNYCQSFGDKFYSYLGADEVNTTAVNYNDLTYLEKYDYFFDFGKSKAYWGNQGFYYKNLYVNIDSAREQLTDSGIAFTELTLKTNTNVTIELYNAAGTKIRTVTNSATAFSLEGVSFVKFVGVNACSNYLTYS